MPLYGIEQEVALLRNNGKEFSDLRNTKAEDLQSLIDGLPQYPEDYPRLRVGDLGIKKKRWYLEGFERFNPDGSFLTTIPKGIEIRTTPRPSPEEALNELRESYLLLAETLRPHGFVPTWISFNPFLESYSPDLNQFELKSRLASPEMQTANLTALTYGPDLNLSFPGMDDKQLIDIGRKLTFYSPYLVPFSFSSPFFKGELWEGYSVRTYLRTGKRPAVMVFLHEEKNMVQTTPSLTQISRVPFEKGRIEFKAFDTCQDPRIYRGLFALLQGLIFEESLKDRSSIPDAKKHQLAALQGFKNPEIWNGAKEMVERAKTALPVSAQKDLEILEEIIETRLLPVERLIQGFKKDKSILLTLNNHANLIV